MDWDKAGPFHEADVARSMLGGWLDLVWQPKDSPTGIGLIALCGRRARDEHETAGLWEYIRRFMQDSPDNLPKTRVIGKMPCPALPWRALQATLPDLWPLAAFKEFNCFALPALLMAPALVLFAFFHWFSLLLCWEPVFPAAIRKACGESFLNAIKARAIDLAAWAMPGGVLYLVWPLLSSIFGAVTPGGSRP